MRTLVMALLILPTSAMAQQIDLTLNQTAQDLGLDEAALESELNAAAADTLKLDNPGSFAQSMAEAAALSTKGLGVDYASNFKKFVVGGAIASSAHEAGFTFKKGEQTLPKGGYAAQLSLMAGLNLGLGGKENGFLDRFRLFANGLALRLPSNREFGGQMGNIGAHLQLKLIGGINAKVTEWGGIDLTSGIEHTTYTFALRQGLPIEAPISGGSAQWTADGTYDVSTTSTSVPLEVSTNLRVAVVTAYLGGAYDLNTAQSTSRVALSGPITGSVDLGTAGQVTDEPLGSASASLTADGAAQPQVGRFFAGVQANVLALKGFAHLNIALNGGVGGHIGVRVAL